MVKKDSLEELILKEPIMLPRNPFVDSFLNFGTDEAVSGAVNVLATALAEYIGLGHVAKSVSGPIVEKIGFFPAHIKEAVKKYRTTPEEHRERLGHYMKNAFKGGLKSLALDIAIHDPMYITMMYNGLERLPETPAWLMAAASFGFAAVAASIIDVGITEARYKLLQNRFRRLGFEKEAYFESRFFIRKEASPEYVLSALKSRFELGLEEKRQYHDSYFLKTNLPEYSGRTPKLRLRKRQEGSGWMQTAQIVYTKAGTISQRNKNQFNFFPIRKDKLYYKLKQEMPVHIENIENHNVKNRLLKILREPDKKEINFERCSVRGPELLASVDTVYNSGENLDREFYVVELKVRKDQDLLVKAMRYVMLNFPVVQVTKGKLELYSQINNH